MNRRELLKGLAAACVAVSTGIQLLPEQRELIAKYHSSYDLFWDRYIHRFDVRVDGNVYCVDAFSKAPALTEDEALQMLGALEHHIGNVKVIAA